LKALVSGVTGQDGSYLTEILLDKGYEVHGIVRRSSSLNTARIDHLYKDQHEDTKLHLHFGDLSVSGQLMELVGDIKPDEIYNLAAMSHVKVSFEVPEYTGDIVGLGTLRMLEAIRRAHPKARMYQASSSELWGSSPPPQNEDTPFSPQSPYAIAKLYAYHMVKNYREAYGIFASNGILTNHESARRGETFVTRKITRAATRIKLGLQDKLYLGNLEAKRDWSHAKDFCSAMVLILQHEKPDDFVIASGVMRTVREFLEAVFTRLDLDYKDYVEIDQRYYRPTEVDALCGDSSKARKVLGWEPKITFDQLVDEMVESDMELAKKELVLKEAGFD